MASIIKTGTRSIADTADNVIHAGRCLLHGFHPELVFTGTVTFRDGAAAGGTIKHVMAIPAAAQTDRRANFGGVLFEKGLTVQLSAGATDRGLIVWEAL